MEIIIIQIIIFILIQFAGSFGIKARNITTLLLCLFTLVMVFTLWLSILQFITIIVSYIFSYQRGIRKNNDDENIEIKYYSNYTEKEKSKKGSNIWVIIFLIISSILYFIWINSSKRKTTINKVDKTVQINKPQNQISTYNYDTLSSSVSDFYKDEIEAYADTIYDKSESYDDYENDEIGDPANENLYYDEIKSSRIYIFYKNIDDNTVESGKLILNLVNDNTFNFKIYVENKFGIGEVNGNAVKINRNRAYFKNENCESLKFYFDDDKIIVDEYNCLNYHGNRISFNAVFIEQ